MTNQEWMFTLEPKKCYKVMNWLFFKYSTEFTMTELAVIDWLKQDYSKSRKPAFDSFDNIIN